MSRVSGKGVGAGVAEAHSCQPNLSLTCQIDLMDKDAAGKTLSR